MKQRITAFLLSLVMLFSVCAMNVSASGSDIRDDTAADYKTALSLAKASSFYGHCNLATAYQLLAIGVYKGGLDFSGAGNQWYSHFSSVSKTSGGYSVITIGGKNCLYDLTKQYGNELYNIVYCLGTGGSSGSKHCLLIRAIINGQVYFADSFGCTYGGTYYPEGACTVLSLDRFVSSYKEMNGDALGCVYFTNGSTAQKPDSSENGKTEETFVPGSYTITASALNVRDKADISGKVLGLLANMEIVTVTEVQQNWGKIQYQGQTGWICLSRDGNDYVFWNGKDEKENELIVTALTADRTTIFLDETVTWTASAIGGSPSTYIYSFAVYRDGELIYTSGDTTGNTVSIQTDKTGVYQAKVTITDSQNAKAELYGDEVTCAGERSEILPGDADGDGKITPADARIVLRTAAGIEILTGSSLTAADYDSDGNVTASDARRILRIAAHLE